MITIILAVGSAIGLALYIGLLVEMNNGSKMPATYGVLKMLVDMTMVVLTSWIAIPFLVVTLFTLKGKAAPMWTIRFTSTIVIGIQKFIAGKQYS